MKQNWPTLIIRKHFQICHVSCVYISGVRKSVTRSAANIAVESFNFSKEQYISRIAVGPRIAKDTYIEVSTDLIIVVLRVK